MRVFVSRQTFDCPEFRCTYTKGLSYTIHPGNKKLEALAEQWALQNKVRFLPVGVTHPVLPAQVAGRGWVGMLIPKAAEPKPVPPKPVEPEPIKPEPTYTEPTYTEQLKMAWKSLWQ